MNVWNISKQVRDAEESRTQPFVARRLDQGAIENIYGLAICHQIFALLQPTL